MAVRKEFLGRGWAFPFQFDPATGKVALSEYEENIRQNITVILGTRPGERQMRPEFGCKIHDLLFAPNTRSTAHMVARHVKEALGHFERRIEVSDVQARIDPSGSVRVEVVYKIISTGAVDSAVHVVSNTQSR
ncbi:MAG: GPW/gp25 family protein [Oligoflexia bacterium]|nr:GPW/gp25 family protein [Oligoflexia bacterium]